MPNNKVKLILLLKVYYKYFVIQYKNIEIYGILNKC